MKKKLIVVGWLALGFTIMCIIGYYHAQKKYTHPHYLSAIAAKRIELLTSGSKCFLAYPLEGGNRITYDVDATTIRSFTDLPSLPEFDTPQNVIIPMNDEVTQALLAGGLIASMKHSVGSVVKGVRTPKAKIAMVLVAAVCTICGYAGGDVIYRHVNPPEYSNEMKTLLNQPDTWNFLAQKTWRRFSRQGAIPPRNPISSADILNAIASSRTTPRTVQ